MNNRQAFTILLAEIEAALQESLTCHNAAAQQGNFDAVEVEIERQRNLVSARNQLQSLQELWSGLVGNPPQSSPSPPIGSKQGRPIFVQYKGRRFDAVLLPNRRVLLNGKEYTSPSGAASAVADGTNVNGWRFWRYLDEEGREQSIDALR